MQSVLAEMPEFHKWSNDFISYVRGLKSEICDYDEGSGFDHNSIGDVSRTLKSELLMHMAKKID